MAVILTEVLLISVLEVSAREKLKQNNGVIVSLLAFSAGRPFSICLAVEEFLSRNFSCSSLFVIQFLVFFVNRFLKENNFGNPGKCRITLVLD